MIRSLFCSLSVLSLSIFVFIQPASAAGHWSLGAEGFYDNYQEPDPGVRVDNDALYGSLTAGYAWSGQHTVAAIDARASVGESDYSSVSGTSENAPQFEGELRMRIGFRETFMGGAAMPYMGLGARAYYDRSQNIVTTLNFVGYDRRIAQVYVPVGIDMSFPSGNWTIKPSFEYDHLLYGRVESDLGGIGNYNNIANNQHDGYGLRASIMFAHQWGRHTWEIGPFIRYWDISDSDITRDNLGRRWVEPDNQRVQTGLAVKVLF